jgi:predicted nucleotide-binding protein (sugar kinase/HSP70/actin superfamily)
MRNVKHFIITEIDGVKQYVRRCKITVAGRAVVTMTTTSKEKAKDFLTKEKVEAFYSRLGIGYAIEESRS